MKLLSSTNNVILISRMASLYPTQRLGPSIKLIKLGQSPGPVVGIGYSEFSVLLSVSVSFEVAVRVEVLGIGDWSQRDGSKTSEWGP